MSSETPLPGAAPGLPCLRCGAPPELVVSHTGRFRFKCSKCDRHRTQPVSTSAFLALEKWNRNNTDRRRTRSVNINEAEDALLSHFDQPVKYDAMGFTRTLRSLMERGVR